MDIHQKYELIDPLGGEGTRSFRARQRATGRDVSVHFLRGGTSPDSQALLARLRNLPPASLSKLIEVAENEGDTIVATVAPPFQHLEEWLAEQEHAPPEGRQLTRAGMWKVPSALPPDALLEAPAAAQVAGEPGEFTKMFRQGAPAASPDQESRVSGAGEFTRLFKASQAVQAPAAPFGAPSPPGSGGPGEFTKMFNSPLPSAPAPGDWPPRDGKPAEPGEFTRIFQSPAPGAPPREPERQGGEFTQMFGQPAFAADPPAAPPAAVQQPRSAPFSGGGATQAFSIPPAPPAAPQGPSEYTRMMQAQAPAAAPPQAPQQAPGMVQFGAPQLTPPQAPQLQYAPPPAPQYAPPVAPRIAYTAPQAPPTAGAVVPAKAPLNWLLIAIVGIAMFIAGAAIVLLVKK